MLRIWCHIQYMHDSILFFNFSARKSYCMWQNIKFSLWLYEDEVWEAMETQQQPEDIINSLDLCNAQCISLLEIRGGVKPLSQTLRLCSRVGHLSEGKLNSSVWVIFIALTCVRIHLLNFFVVLYTWWMAYGTIYQTMSQKYYVTHSKTPQLNVLCRNIKNTTPQINN